MGVGQFIKLSKAGEGPRIEYKMCIEQISESLYETVCSFLNHSGGYILVGVRNNGEIVGVNPNKAETLKANIITCIKNQKQFLPSPYFTPQLMEVEGKTVLFPLLVRVFHELSWVEDMGSGTRNILRYAPLYYSGYKIQINNGSQFIFSITYMEMSPETAGNVTINQSLSPENRVKLEDDDLCILLGDTFLDKKTALKKRRRQQGIIRLIKENPNITIEAMAENLDVHERTIHRDIEELKDIIVYAGPNKGGHWMIVKKSQTNRS